MDLTAVSRVVRFGVHLEDNYDLEVDFLGRRGLDRENSWTLELSGRHLAYQIQVDNTALFLKLMEMDCPSNVWLPVLSLLDTAANWEVIHDLVAKLEKYQIKSLRKPIIVGGIGPGGFAIA